MTFDRLVYWVAAYLLFTAANFTASMVVPGGWRNWTAGVRATRAHVRAQVRRGAGH